MAAPDYRTDLEDISLAEDETDWDESGDGAWNEGGGAEPEPDYYIQGTYCISETLKDGVGSLIYDYGTGITFSTGDVFVAWHYDQAPNVLGLRSEGGMRMIIGSSLDDFYAWKVLGRDYYEYGGWVCIPIDPERTADYTVGTPTATRQFFGNAFNHNNGSVQKGNPHGIDALRYGRMESIFAGGDLANGYCTFAGFAEENDNQQNRWGQIQEIPGGYQWQGLMSFGTAASACDFRDENVSIVALSPHRVYETFNKIEINNSSTRVDWDTITFSALGSAAPGYFQVNDPSADVNITDCTFVDMATFQFSAGSDIIGTTFRRCESVTQSGAAFDGCTFDSMTASAHLYAEDLADIDNCDFIQPDVNGGHAIHIATSGTYAFLGNTFTGYGASATTSAAIYNNSGAHITINVSQGDTPTIRNSPGSTTTVQNTVQITFTDVVSGSEIRILEAGTNNELDGIEDVPASGEWTYSYNYVAGTYIDYVVHHVEYVYIRVENFLLPATNQDIRIDQQFDRWYSNPP